MQKPGTLAENFFNAVGTPCLHDMKLSEDPLGQLASEGLLALVLNFQIDLCRDRTVTSARKILEVLYKEMGIILYHVFGSPPCTAVRLTAKYLGIGLELQDVDLPKGEHLKPEFLTMNPQHTVPTLDDNGFFLSESHAILPYLVNTYGKEDDPLYPKDPKARYLVDHRLAFNLGTLYQRFISIIHTFVFEKTPVKPGDVEKLKEALGFANSFLQRTPYIAGDHLTIADFSVTLTLACMESVNYDLSPYPAVVKYLDKMKAEMKGYDEVVKASVAGLAKWANDQAKIIW